MLVWRTSCRWFEPTSYHKQGDATVVNVATWEDKEPKCKDELLQPWTTDIEWYYPWNFERSQSVSSQNWDKSTWGCAAARRRTAWVRIPDIPRSPELTGYPHSHMAASPLTWWSGVVSRLCNEGLVPESDRSKIRMVALRGFESHVDYKIDFVAQLVEQYAFNIRVRRSNRLGVTWKHISFIKTGRCVGSWIYLRAISVKWN